MFANPIWSVLILCVPVLIYWFVIRPRLKAQFTDLYSHIDSFWARWAARLYAFRTFAIAAWAALMVAMPDLLVQIAPMDFSFLPQPWAGYVSPAALFLIALMKAFETKPKDERA